MDKDGLLIPLYAVYNTSGGQSENPIDFVSELQKELVWASDMCGYSYRGRRLWVYATNRNPERIAKVRRVV